VTGQLGRAWGRDVPIATASSAPYYRSMSRLLDRGPSEEGASPESDSVDTFLRELALAPTRNGTVNTPRAATDLTGHSLG
jgi:hypothetical protein